jgi:hypothetical protein
MQAAPPRPVSTGLPIVRQSCGGQKREAHIEALGFRGVGAVGDLS